MYEAYYGLREKPFSLIPNPEFLYPSKNHQMALALLKYGLSEQTGFVVISGDIGSGKTTVVREILRTADRDLVIGVITNTHESLGDLMDWIPRAFDVDLSDKDRIDRYHAFVDFMIQTYGEGKRTVLIVDEAQNLSPSSLEQLRTLSNINADNHFVLQLILVGQPELKDSLKRPDMKQFAQRVYVYYDLKPLSLQDTIGYIRHRIGVVGGDDQLFDLPACAAIYHYTFGTPRLINILCDLALVYGYAQDRWHINLDVVLEVVDQRQATGLGIFRDDPENLSSQDRKRMIFQLLSDDGQVITEFRKASQ